MKNYTTPRTLAECQFTTGYRSHRLNKRSGIGEWLYVATTLAAVIAVGVMLAWRG